MFTKRTVVVTLASGVVVACLAMVVYLAIFTPPALAKMTFTLYEPTQFPQGVQIVNRRLDVDHTGREIGSATLSFRKVDNVYAITELKATGKYPDTYTALTNYDQQSVKPTCKQNQTPLGMSYRLCHWIDYGRYGVYQMNFVKGGTYVRVWMNYNPQKTLPDDDLNSFVDSFAPRSQRGIPVYSYSAG